MPGGEGRGDAPPLILVGRDGRKRVVVAADTKARSLGIQPGMAASMAQALVAGLVVHDADPAADAQALDRLALWLLRRYAPVVATDPPDGLMTDVTGDTHLHPNLPVVLTSGNSQVLAQDGLQGFELLRKPYSMEQLSSVIMTAILKTTSVVA